MQNDVNGDDAVDMNMHGYRKMHRVWKSMANTNYKGLILINVTVSKKGGMGVFEC